jgi:hypothetical protein
MNRKALCFVFFFSFANMAFSGPFGIDFGMSLEQVGQVCKTPPENIESDLYEITPPNTNEIFESYLVQIHPTYGVYFIKAIGKDISTNAQGTRLKNQFNSLVSSIEKTYGKYKKDDSAVPGSYWGDKPDYYVFALSRDERTLDAYWGAGTHAKLPPEISLIAVAAKGIDSSTGYLILEYYSKDYEKIDAEQESVF